MLYKFRLVLTCVSCSLSFALLGWLLGLIFSVGFVGFCIGLLLGFACWFVGVAGSEQFILDVYDAKLIDALASPNLYKTVRKLSADMGIDDPLLYSIPLERPNALAVARPDRSSVIIMMEGLMRKLDHEEVRAILALMVARIAKREAAACCVGATLAGAPISALSSASFRQFIRSKRLLIPDVGLTRLEKALYSAVVPLCAFTWRLAFDPAFLMEADGAAARLTGSPAALVSALSKIDAAGPDTWWGTTPYNPATALLFAVPPLAAPDRLYPENPFIVRMQKTFTNGLPTVEERSTRLRGLAEKTQAPVAV